MVSDHPSLPYNSHQTSDRSDDQAIGAVFRGEGRRSTTNGTSASTTEYFQMPSNSVCAGMSLDEIEKLLAENLEVGYDVQVIVLLLEMLLHV